MEKSKEEINKPVWTDEEGGEAYSQSKECCPLCDSTNTYAERTEVTQRRRMNDDCAFWEEVDDGYETYHCYDCEGYIEDELTTMSILPEFITVGSLVKLCAREVINGAIVHKQELITGIHRNKHNKELGYYLAYSEPSKQTVTFSSWGIKEVLSYGEVNNG